MSITSPKGTFGIASLFILCLIGSLYYAYDKSAAYDELQESYQNTQVAVDSPASIIINTITEEETRTAKGLIQGSFDDLWGGMDSTKILDYYTKDFYILEHGEIWNNDRVKLFMKTSLDRESLPKRVNRMEYHTIEKYGDAINIAYDNYGDFYQDDSLVWEGHWLESALIIPTETGWRIRTMHSTRISVEQTK